MLSRARAIGKTCKSINNTSPPTAITIAAVGELEGGELGWDYIARCLSVSAMPIFSSVTLFNVPVTFNPSAC